MSNERDDERFAELLTAFDEALDNGDIATFAARCDNTEAVMAEPRLRQAQRCILLLEMARRLEQDALADGLRAPFQAEDAARQAAPTELTIDRFAIVRELGRGGYGVVFLAVDPKLDRLVALKVPHPEVLISADLKRRFLRESRAAAGLNHANVVTVYEVGETGPLCWIAAEYCQGVSLADVVRDHPRGLPPRLAAGWVAQLAEGIEHAHRHGILHRDLKPSNVMLVATEQRPEIDVTNCDQFTMLNPKVLDFGLAKVLDANHDATRSGAILGTPAYMSPEQIDRNRGAIDARTDVYGLGALLYSLLAGRPPFEGESNAEVFQQVLLDEPAPLRKLRRDTPPDLNTICMKCLAKAPSERYASAQALSDDLSRFVRREPIQARRITASQRILRWCQRKPAIAALSAVAVVAAIVIGAGSLWYKQQLQHAQHIANTERFYSLLTTARERPLRGTPGWSWEALDKITEAATLEPAGERKVELRNAAATCLTAVDLRPVGEIAHGMNPYCLCFSPDGRLLAVGQNHHVLDDKVPVQLWDVPSRKLRSELWFQRREGTGKHAGRPDGVRSLAFSPDSKLLAVGTRAGWIHVWDFSTQPPRRHEWRGHSDYVRGMIFVAGGTVLISGAEDGRLMKWSVPQGELLQSIQLPRALVGLAIGANGSLLACGMDASKGENELVVLNTASLESAPAFERHTLLGEQVAFGSEGRLLAASGNADVLVFIDAESGQLVRKLIDPELGVAHDDSASSMQLSSDGGLLITGSPDQSVKLWDVPSGRLTATIAVGGRGSAFASLHPSDDLLAVSFDHGVRLFELRHAAIRSESFQPRAIKAFDITANGKGIGIAIPRSDDGVEASAVVLYDRVQRLEIGKWLCPDQLDGNVDIAIDSRGGAVAVASDPRSQFWLGATRNGLTHNCPAKFPDAIAFDHSSPIVWAAFQDPLDPPTGFVGCISAFDAATGERLTTWQNLESKQTLAVSTITSLAVGTRYLVAGSHDATVKVFNFVGRGTLELTATAESANGHVTDVALSPDETLVLAGTSQGGMMTLRPGDGQITSESLPHGDAITALAFSADGKLAASAGGDRRLLLWQRVDDQLKQVLSLRVPTRVVRLEFTSDGRELVVLLQGETALRVLQLDLLQRELAAIGLGW
jgi:serine/threonine protein kinase/WD40 repeat protein